MRFSIIVPAYNAERFLNECLESIERQNYLDYEIVIIEDGSTDGTSNIADLARKNNNKITVVHKNNQGLLLARCDGIRNSKGDYVIFLDADDMLNPRTLQVCSDIIDQKNPDLIIYGMTNDSNYKIGIEKEADISAYFDANRLDDLRLLLCQGKFHSMCGKAIRRSCFTDQIPYKKYGGLMHGEDFLQCIYLFDSISSAYISKEKLYFYRPSPEASTSRYKSSQLQDLKKVLFELDKMSAKWGKKFFDEASVGKALQICYLLRLLVKSKLEIQEKQDEVTEISNTLKDYGFTMQVIKKTKVRLDQKIVLYACLNRDVSLLKRIVKLTDGIRKLTGRYR